MRLRPSNITLRATDTTQWTVKLRKAERAVDQQQGVASSQQMAPAPAPMEQQQQQPPPQQQQQQYGEEAEYPAPVFNPAANMQPPRTAAKKQLNPNEDEWGQEELGDDL